MPFVVMLDINIIGIRTSVDTDSLLYSYIYIAIARRPPFEASLSDAAGARF